MSATAQLEQLFPTNEQKAVLKAVVEEFIEQTYTRKGRCERWSKKKRGNKRRCLQRAPPTTVTRRIRKTCRTPKRCPYCGYVRCRCSSSYVADRCPSCDYVRCRCDPAFGSCPANNGTCSA